MFKLPEKGFKPTTSKFRIRRNESWLESVKIGLVHGIWNAPSSLIHDLKFPVMSFIGATGLLVSASLLWVWMRIFLIVAAFCGYLVVPSERNQD